jgi:hypothetical protein
MGEAARETIREKSWDTAFEMTYNAYRFCHQSAAASHEFDRKPVLACPETPLA